MKSESLNNTIQLLTNQPHSYTKIVNRLRYSVVIKKLNISHYLPPTYKDSNFFIDLISIIFPKNSNIRNNVDIV